MNKFLEISHKALNLLTKYDKIHIVLGNESCDLDSAISSLVYAYFLYNHSYSTACKGNSMAIPVLNIHEDDFPLRTETTYFLKKHNILPDHITFRNQVDLTKLSKENKLMLTLVDHHILPIGDEHLTENIVGIIDHRPIDKSANFKSKNITIDTVGSCTTLIADEILKTDKNILDNDIANLLHGTIVLDTINFDPDAKRYKDLDCAMAERLEKEFDIVETRNDIYKKLSTARSDVSTLAPFQILHKDMKIILHTHIPGVPMLIDDFLKMNGSSDALNQFCQKHKTELIVLIGLARKNGLVLRDVAVFGTDGEFKCKIVNVLKNNAELNLEEMTTGVKNLVYFKQNNVKMSRKHIIPIIRPVIEEYFKQ